MTKLAIISIILSILLFGGTSYMSENFWGYDRAGTYYLNEQKEHRKSVRQGSHGFYYYGHGPYGTGGFRGGK
jgi:hypothetical protein